LAAGVHPGLLVVEILPAALTAGIQGAIEDRWLHGSAMPLRELAWVRNYSDRAAGLLRQWCLSRCLVCASRREQLSRCLGLDAPESLGGSLQFAAMDGYGWQPFHRTVTPEQRAVWMAASCDQYQAAMAAGHLADRPVQALNALLERCREEHIPVALVLMPETSAFRALYKPATTACINALLEDFRRRHIWVIDARTWVPDDGFWDAHHLLPDGAALFTDRFGRDGLRPVVRELEAAFPMASAAPIPGPCRR
jgi:hypothetical protein